MREIKFRAWDIENRQMVIHRRFVSHHAFAVTENGYIYQDGVLLRDGSEDDLWVLMQYTGLKDKNGVEIYEGDIVVDTRDEERLHQEIRWYRGGFMRHKNGHFGFKDIEAYDGDCKYFEVIGNIYENPELLKDGDA